MSIQSRILDKFINWLIKEEEPTNSPLCDFDRLSFEIRTCDVLLVEGRSRVSEVIKNITNSPWTHSALYIGRINEIEDDSVRARVEKYYKGDSKDQLIIEALLGEGTIVSKLDKYRKDHLRICRPNGLSRQDALKITEYVVNNLGVEYDVRHLMDLARFLYPYWIMPRRWRSSLFERNVSDQTRALCSTMIASAYTSVHFPILPVVQRTDDGKLRMYKRNTRLYTPRDFDYSPYFAIVKYALLGFDDLAVYRQLPWDQNGVVCNDENDCYIPELTQVEQKEKKLTQETTVAQENNESNELNKSSGKQDSKKQKKSTSNRNTTIEEPIPAKQTVKDNNKEPVIQKHLDEESNG